MKSIIFSYEDLLDDDDDFKKWKKEWKKIPADQKLAHTQKFFRMLLSTDSDDESLYFFSFCQDDVFNNDNAWHCINCQRCQEWNEWHCGQCNKCKDFFVFNDSIALTITTFFYRTAYRCLWNDV